VFRGGGSLAAIVISAMAMATSNRMTIAERDRGFWMRGKSVIDAACHERRTHGRLPRRADILL
jgi:hypothetical protein